MAARLDRRAGHRGAGAEHLVPQCHRAASISAPMPTRVRRLVAGVRRACRLADPGQADSQRHADRRHRPRGAADGGADAVSLINTVSGHGDRLAAAAAAAGQRPGRTERPGHQADRAALRLPGRPSRADSHGRHRRHRHDRRRAWSSSSPGRSAVQIGTANYYDPTVTMKLLDALPRRWPKLASRRWPNSSARCRPIAAQLDGAGWRAAAT